VGWRADGDRLDDGRKCVHVTSKRNVFSGVARLRLPALAAGYGRAIAEGADETGTTADEERLQTALGLMTRAAAHAPDVFTHLGVVQVDLGMHGVEGSARSDIAPFIARTARFVAAVMRLEHRALTVHARDTGYDVAPWVERVPEHAQALLSLAALPIEDQPELLPLTEARVAHVELTTAIAATESDRMDVPSRLSDSLAHWLCVWTLVDHLRAGAAERAAPDA
jgi:hypothetical protein